MEKKKVFRKSYLVKQRLQLKVFGLVILMLFSFTLVIGVSLYLPLLSILFSNLPPESATLQGAASFYLDIEKYVWLSILGVIILLGLYSIILSHQIAGPIYRFEQTLEEIREGNLSLRIQLRRNDELKDFGSRFNETLDFLNGQISRANQIAEELEKQQAALLSLCRSGIPQTEEIERGLSALGAQIFRFRETLSAFKLSPSPEPESPPR
jgi:methyl-accepting chemotaxis protein